MNVVGHKPVTWLACLKSTHFRYAKESKSRSSRMAVIAATDDVRRHGLREFLAYNATHKTYTSGILSSTADTSWCLSLCGAPCEVGASHGPHLIDLCNQGKHHHHPDPIFDPSSAYMSTVLADADSDTDNITWMSKK